MSEPNLSTDIHVTALTTLIGVMLARMDDEDVDLILRDLRQIEDTSMNAPNTPPELGQAIGRLRRFLTAAVASLRPQEGSTSREDASPKLSEPDRGGG